MYPNLKLQIWRSGIRQQQLAKALGLHETVLSKIVNGSRTPSPQLKNKIAAALNADVNWLFEAMSIAAPAKAAAGGVPQTPKQQTSGPDIPDEDDHSAE